MESFEERRGKYLFSCKDGGKYPDFLHINSVNCNFSGINNDRNGSVFSVTVADDSERLFIDLKHIEVRPIGWHEREVRGWKRSFYWVAGCFFVQSAIAAFLLITS